MKDLKPLPKKSTGAPAHRKVSKTDEVHRFVIGRNPVSELVRSSEGSSRIIRAVVQRHESGSDAKGNEILAQLREQKIPVAYVSRDELSTLCDSHGHQGFALEVRERKILDLHGLLELAATFDRGLIIALDGVQDPQNLGSILRAAECLGAKAVFWSHNRNVGITPVVSKVSAGASEVIPLAAVSNLRDALDKLKKEGFWSVACMLSDDSEKLHRFSFPEKTCLILGAEGEGVKPLVAKEADFRVAIEQFGVIDSLNVSQAASVFLAEFARQKLVNDDG